MNEIHTKEVKNEQRRQALANRRAMSAQERISRSHQICEFLMRLPVLQYVKTIFSYQAVFDEADLNEFHAWAAAHGKILAYPIALPGGIMKAAVPEAGDAFKKSAYGILEPDIKKSTVLEPEEIDLVLVPCVAFDRKGGRLGHGAGYYDRYLPACRKDAVFILVGFDVQELSEVERDERDVMMHMIITESGLRYNNSRS